MKKVIIIGGCILATHLILQSVRNNAPSIHYVEKLPFGLNAMTVPPIGIFINKKHEGNTELLNHELIHWNQYQELGLVGFYFNYAKENSQHGYDGNEMEIAARSNESDYCKTNYTECVRNGKAKTIYEPSFRL